MNTVNVYDLPVSQSAVTKIINKNGVSHINFFENALDFLVPLGTKVVSPYDGQITNVIDNYDQFGKTEKFAKFANFIQIMHPNNEVSDLVHLAKGSSLVKIGDKVKKGQPVAITGESGWMAEPHLHWFVWQTKGLRIRTSSDINLY